MVGRRHAQRRRYSDEFCCGSRPRAACGLSAHGRLASALPEAAGVSACTGAWRTVFDGGVRPRCAISLTGVYDEKPLSRCMRSDWSRRSAERTIQSRQEGSSQGARQPPAATVGSWPRLPVRSQRRHQPLDAARLERLVFTAATSTSRPRGDIPCSQRRAGNRSAESCLSCRCRPAQLHRLTHRPFICDYVGTYGDRRA